jgi:hypothetical protein
MIHYAVVHPSGALVNIRVVSAASDPRDRYQHEQEQSPGGAVHFRATASTTYHICISTAVSQTQGVAVAIHTLVSGEYVKLDETIKIGQVRDVEAVMRGILAVSNQILWKQSYVAEASIRRDDSSRDTSSRAGNLALLECCLAILLSAGQMWYMRHLLQRGRGSNKLGRMV